MISRMVCSWPIVALYTRFGTLLRVRGADDGLRAVGRVRVVHSLAIEVRRGDLVRLPVKAHSISDLSSLLGPPPGTPCHGPNTPPKRTAAASTP